MYWTISIKMYTHDRQDWYWSPCCRVESSEMLGIVEGALKQHQTIKVEEHRYTTPAWAERKDENGK